MTNSPSVAVITSTIGRSSLERAIQSVQQQSYPCTHYIFVDGKKFSQQVRSISNKYPNVIVIYLPMNTGANDWKNSSINTIAPYLVNEDILCYLDDDNWYEKHHIETIVQCFQQDKSLDFVYSLRHYYEEDGTFICEDNHESLGIWENKMVSPPYQFTLHSMGNSYPIFFKAQTKHHIDTNCYAFSLETARQLAPTWFSGIHNDRHIFQKISECGLKGQCTKQYTLNYTIAIKSIFGLEKAFKNANIPFEYTPDIRQQEIEFFRTFNLENIKRHNGQSPWKQL